MFPGLNPGRCSGFFYHFSLYKAFPKSILHYLQNQFSVVATPLNCRDNLEMTEILTKIQHYTVEVRYYKTERSLPIRDAKASIERRGD